MEELSSLGIDLLLIKLDGIRFMLGMIFIVLTGVLGFIIGASITYLTRFRKRNKDK